MPDAPLYPVAFEEWEQMVLQHAQAAQRKRLAKAKQIAGHADSAHDGYRGEAALDH
jgi:hypothetical protein